VAIAEFTSKSDAATAARTRFTPRFVNSISLASLRRCHLARRFARRFASLMADAEGPLKARRAASEGGANSVEECKGAKRNPTGRIEVQRWAKKIS
jgi:hypothetical protein